MAARAMRVNGGMPPAFARVTFHRSLSITRCHQILHHAPILPRSPSLVDSDLTLLTGIIVSAIVLQFFGERCECVL